MEELTANVSLILRKLKTLDSIETTVKNFDQQFKDLREQVTKIEQSQSTNNNDITKVKVDLEMAKTEINQLRQYNLRDDFALYGLPPDIKSEYVTPIIINFCSNISIKITEKDIKNCYIRLIKNKSEASIVGTFTDSTVKQNVMKAFKAKKMVIIEDVVTLAERSPWKGKNLIIRNQLTSANRQLLKEVRSINDNVFAFIWENNGRILARKSNGERFVVINSFSHFIELWNEAKKMQV